MNNTILLLKRERGNAVNAFWSPVVEEAPQQHDREASQLLVAAVSRCAMLTGSGKVDATASAIPQFLLLARSGGPLQAGQILPLSKRERFSFGEPAED